LSSFPQKRESSKINPAAVGLTAVETFYETSNHMRDNKSEGVSTEQLRTLAENLVLKHLKEGSKTREIRGLFYKIVKPG